MKVALDQAVRVQRPAVAAVVKRQRGRRPDSPPADILRSLEKQFLAAMTATGAAVGGVAAAPGVGTGAALALSAGETLTFLESSALFALAFAEVYGIRIDDLERRRTLLLAILLGDGGANLVEKAAGRTGAHWGRVIVNKIPMSSIRQMNKVLGRWFITKYGTKQGIVVLGRLVPFGVGAAIGAGGNALFAKTVIKGTRRAFGPPPADWSHLAEDRLNTHAQDRHRTRKASSTPAPASASRETSPSGKYLALYASLMDVDADVVILSLDELSATVGGLPTSAWTQRAWWGNGSSKPQARAWLAAGFTVTDVDLEAQKVTFSR